eukprot:gene10371-12127_t
MRADRFWDNVYSSNGEEWMSSGTAEGDHKTNALSVVVSSLDNIYNTSHSITSEGFVYDLPGFQYLNQDCETIALGNNSRPQSRAFPVPTCQPGYAFPLPDLPPHSALLLTYTANKRLLSRESQPIDASRGALVPPAVMYTCNALSGCRVQSTKSFIVTSPIPDSSMPFNVITLVSTLSVQYDGTWVNDLYHGTGTLIKPNGTVYSGEFKHHKPHGTGITRRKNSTHQGQYHRGQLHGPGTYSNAHERFEGIYVDNIKQGYGRREIAADNSVYEGEWVDNAPHGVGTFTYQDGSAYRGNLVRGQKHGKGVSVSAEG